MCSRPAHVSHNCGIMTQHFATRCRADYLAHLQAIFSEALRWKEYYATLAAHKTFLPHGVKKKILLDTEYFP